MWSTPTRRLPRPCERQSLGTRTSSSGPTGLALPLPPCEPHGGWSEPRRSHGAAASPNLRPRVERPRSSRHEFRLGAAGHFLPAQQHQSREAPSQHHRLRPRGRQRRDHGQSRARPRAACRLLPDAQFSPQFRHSLDTYTSSRGPFFRLQDSAVGLCERDRASNMMPSASSCE